MKACPRYKNRAHEKLPCENYRAHELKIPPRFVFKCKIIVIIKWNHDGMKDFQKISKNVCDFSR
jgi:hypothetical protein